MDYRSLFGVVVRALGLVLVWNGINQGFWALAENLGAAVQWHLPQSIHALSVALYLAAGLATIRGADVIVDFAYAGRKA
jgi:hypothetical protein